MAQIAPQSPTSPDWTAQAADRIEAVVASVRDKTTVPVRKVARAIVFGFIAAVLGILAGFLVIIGLFRLHVYLPFGHNEGRKIWVTDVGVGAIFLAAGAFTWRYRKPRHKG
jgi:hypothetical protein